MELALAVAMMATAYAWSSAVHRQAGVTGLVLAVMFFSFTGSLLWKVWHTI